MGLDRLEQGVCQHHNVDQPLFDPLASDDYGGGGDAGDGGLGGWEMAWSRIQLLLLRFSYACCCWWRS